MNVWSTVEADIKRSALIPWPELQVPYSVCRPEKCIPIVFASPHSGRCYPQAFQNQSQLGRVALRGSEDAWVDEFFCQATDLGASTLFAHFPRAMVDVNRSEDELDPSMFGDHCPPMAVRQSSRTAAGLGVIPRIVAAGVSIYAEPIAYAEAMLRLQHLYTPYHNTLADLMRQQKRHFGYAYLVDCHSMPSSSGRNCPGGQADFVLGDGHGRTCAPAFSALIEQRLVAMGYRVARNIPYAGGFSTLRYGKPEQGFEALQIEINRALYMDETRMQKTSGFSRLKQDMQALSEDICAFVSAQNKANTCT